MSIQKVIITVVNLFFALSLFSQKYVADFEVAKEEVLRSIPEEYINKARNELVVAYQHTSHGTHVSYGVFGLQDFKEGDELLFGLSGSANSDKLEFRDYALSSYAPEGITGLDLSLDETAFIQTTRNYLNATENASVNVVMWSWCNIAGHNVSGNYLPGMDSLISEYSSGGSMIGTENGQREIPVTFIFMTGHANLNANVGDGNPKNQAGLITEYCKTNSQYCLDYYSIDSHDMEDNYWEDVGDNGNSAAYGGNFYEDWQSAKSLGEDYYENKTSPGGSVEYGAHITQHITANRKAYALWWILSRMVGWDGQQSSVQVSTINLSSEGGVSEIQIGEDLQFAAEVLPSDASNKDVTWSINDQSGTATITQSGLLTATAEGTVMVVATALDGSGVTGSISIQILENNTSYNRIESKEFLVYPNPSNGNVTIVNFGDEISNMIITNINGVSVFSGQPPPHDGMFSLDLTSYYPGIYMLWIIKNKEKFLNRILILP